MSDRIAVFNNGRIEQIGTPTELYDRPATRFVASFIGETNLFQGTVVEIEGGYCRIEAGGLLLRARHDGRAGLRQPVSLAVRPERVRLMSANAANTHADNRLAGKVVELIYLGRFRKYVVRAQSDGAYGGSTDRGRRRSGLRSGPCGRPRLGRQGRRGTAGPDLRLGVPANMNTIANVLNGVKVV